MYMWATIQPSVNMMCLNVFKYFLFGSSFYYIEFVSFGSVYNTVLGNLPHKEATR